MNITFLGTGAAEGVPAAFCPCPVCEHARKEGGRNVRSRAAALVDGKLLLDVTSDIFTQARACKSSLDGVGAVLFTHKHWEHCMPWELRNMRPPYAIRQSDSVVSVCGSELTVDFVRDTLGDWEWNKLSSMMELRPLEPFKTVSLCGYDVTALPARHCEGAYIYILQADGKALLYGTDSGYFYEEVWDFLRGVELDVVALDCNDLFEVETPNHMNLEDCVTVQRRLFQLGCVNTRTRFYATHIGHAGKMNHMQLDERMRLYGIHPAYDGLVVEV